MRPALLLIALSAAACAATQEASGPPDLTPLQVEPLPPNGRLVVDCVRQAVQAGTYAAVRDENAGLIRFVCNEAPARALFEGLAERSAREGSEWREGTMTVRASERVEEDLYGVDLCRDLGGAWACEVHLNVGDFMFD